MAQVMSVKLSRTDAAPWGFRLQGGKDFGSPLLIQKVNGGSPAERAGLQAGDAVIKVNNVEVFNLRHKDAQDNIVRAGNSFEITVQRGGSTWKPLVTPVGPQPVISSQAPGHVTPVTKTSLAANKPASSPIGSAHNYSPSPFGQSQQVNGTGGEPVKSIVNKQYNSPVGIYSEETIAETLSAQAEVLAGGVLGVNFKKNEKNYDPANSEVFKMLNEIANEPRTPEPERASGMQYFSHSSHAIGGRATSPRPTTPLAQRMGPPPQSVTKSPLPQHAVKPLPQSAVKPLPKTGVAAPNVATETPQCSDCERFIVGVFVRIKDKNLHVECFKCATCGTSLKNVGYYNINNKLYCDVHAKLVARQHPPAPDLEPVTVLPGGPKPAGAISAALANRGPMTRPAPASPQPSTLGPMPFHPPRSGPSHVQSPRPVQSPGGFSGVKPSFNALPSMTGMPAAQKLPSMPSAPVPAPFTTPAKPAPAGSKFAWPPKVPSEDVSTSPTATPLYIPPGPLNQSAPLITLFDQSAAPIAVDRPQTLPFPQPYSDFISNQPVARPMSAYQYIPKPLGSNEARPKSAFAAPSKSELLQSDPAFPPTSATRNVTFDGAVTSSTNFEEATSSAHRKKFSVCSQEVMGITERREMSSSIEQLSETIDTAILVSALTGRPESPVPMEHVQQELLPSLPDLSQNEVEAKTAAEDVRGSAAALRPRENSTTHKDEEEIVVALKNVIGAQADTVETMCEEYLKHSETESGQSVQQTKPQPWQSQLVSALTTAPDRPYSPLPATLPVSYRQLPQPTEGFVPIAREEPYLLPVIVDQPPHSTFVSALTVAPDRPYSPLPQPAPPLPAKPVPFPEQTEPYRRPEQCPSPLISALTVAPQRPYSPFTVTKAPTSVLDSIQDMKANIDSGEPFDLPTPSHYSSMLAALTVAPDRPYSPLTVTRAPTMTTDTRPKEARPEPSFRVVPPKIVGDIQGAVYKPSPPDKESIPRNRDVLEADPTKAFPPVTEDLKRQFEVQPNQLPVMKVEDAAATPEPEVVETPQEKQITKKTTVKTAVIEKAESSQILKTENQTPPTNALNLHRQTQQRPITPKIPRPITPSAITGLQKPATIPYYQQNIGDGDFPCRSPRPVTPTLICPMTVPRPQTPGIQAGGRAVTPIPHKQLQVVRSLTPIQQQQQQGNAQHLESPDNNPQVLVTKKTRTTEEFESFHKESTKIIEKSGTLRKCLTELEKTSEMAKQSVMQSSEITAITNSNVLYSESETSTLQSTRLAAQSQQITYGNQHNTLPALQSTPSPVCPQQTPDENPKNIQIFVQNQQNTKSTAQHQQLAVQKQQDSLKIQQDSKDNFISLEESQRASPLPFPNISLPEGMKYEVVDNKALYTAGNTKQVFKLSQPSGSEMGQRRDSVPQFKIQAPTNKQPFIQLMSPKFEPLGPRPVADCVPPCQQPARQTKFQPLAPQPVPSVSKPIQAPTATLPVNVVSSQQHGNSFQPVAPKPLANNGTQNFTPKSSGNGFQTFNSKCVPVAVAPRQGGSSRRASCNNGVPVPTSSFVAPRRESRGSVLPEVVTPPIRAPELMDPCTSPPNAGGGSGPKGASFAGSSAPVRGRGVLNQAMGPGARQALCGQCHGQIRGPFVTALGKIWCPEHFVCVNAQCKRQLADIGFVEEKGQLYCEYCFEQFIAPPCNKCSAKIKGDCLNAIGKHFHPECFVCCYCGKLFGNNPFFLEDGMAYCQADWNELFTTKCFACGFPIEAGDRWVEALNNNYHSQCFNCTTCKKNLEGQSFFAKSGRPFCKAHAR